jgi:hypothetical protein
MAFANWMIKGPKIGACSCDYGCPCEFNGRPTHGSCEGLEAMRIDEGWFEGTRLDGLLFAARFHWPGAVHEGKGTVQGAISAHADEAQREALMNILGGEEQVETTVFNIYGSTIETELDPVFADIEFECDIEARTGRFHVPGMMELGIEPILNPVTGRPHRAQIRLPEGFEFREAEMGSATFTSADRDVLARDHGKVYGALTYVAYGPHGIID